MSIADDAQKLLALALAATSMVVASPIEPGTSLANPLDKRAGTKKPTGGPAVMSVTVYSGPATCSSSQTPPPTDGSAGAATTVSLAENQCVILTFPTSGVFTAKLTQAPKTGTTACYVQLFQEQGCGLTLTNQYHGFPFDGVDVGNSVGCAKPAGLNYGAVEIVCA